LLISDLLLLKLVLVAPLIAGVSLAGRRWGPSVGGWLAGLPWTSGPVALFLAIEQGGTFAATAAQGTLLGLVSVAAFCLAYSWTARRGPWGVSVLVGWSAFFVTTFVLQRISLSLVGAFAGVIGVLAGVLILLPKVTASGHPPAPPRWEIPLRMGAATGMVLAITGAAAALGPQLSGLLTPFPVYATVLAIFTQHAHSAAAAAALLRGVVLGSFAFGVFFLVLAASLMPWGLPASFGVALVAALLVQGVSYRFLR